VMCLGKARRGRLRGGQGANPMGWIRPDLGSNVRRSLGSAHLPGGHFCEGRTRCDGRGATPKLSRWDGSEKAEGADAGRVGEYRPHRGVHGRIAGAPAQREGRAG
jgi:hypothetical protein